MPAITEGQIRQAKSIGLLSYLQAAEPYELVRSSASEYRLASHGSLVSCQG